MKSNTPGSSVKMKLKVGQVVGIAWMTGSGLAGGMGRRTRATSRVTNFGSRERSRRV